MARALLVMRPDCEMIFYLSVPPQGNVPMIGDREQSMGWSDCCRHADHGGSRVVEFRNLPSALVCRQEQRAFFDLLLMVGHGGIGPRLRWKRIWAVFYSAVRGPWLSHRFEASASSPRADPYSASMMVALRRRRLRTSSAGRAAAAGAKRGRVSPSVSRRSRLRMAERDRAAVDVEPGRIGAGVA